MNITARTRRWLAAAIAGCSAILLPGMALAAPAAPAHPALHATAPGCETPGLVIWLDTNGKGTARQRLLQPPVHQPVRAHLHAERFPVHHRGQPDRRPARRRAAFDHTTTPHSVTVKNGATVEAVLQILAVDNLPPSKCKPVTAAGRRVFPAEPDQGEGRPVPLCCVFGERSGVPAVAAGHEVAAPGVRGGPGQARRPPCTLGEPADRRAAGADIDLASPGSLSRFSSNLYLINIARLLA